MWPVGAELLGAPKHPPFPHEATCLKGAGCLRRRLPSSGLPAASSASPPAGPPWRPEWGRSPYCWNEKQSTLVGPPRRGLFGIFLKKNEAAVFVTWFSMSNYSGWQPNVHVHFKKENGHLNKRQYKQELRPIHGFLCVRGRVFVNKRTRTISENGLLGSTLSGRVTGSSAMTHL